MMQRLRSRAEASAILADIVTTGTIAERLGVAHNVVANWPRRYRSFPDPIGAIGKASVYWWPEIDLWIRLGESDRREG